MIALTVDAERFIASSYKRAPISASDPIRTLRVVISEDPFREVQNPAVIAKPSRAV
jgi:hypothetical protein